MSSRNGIYLSVILLCLAACRPAVMSPERVGPASFACPGGKGLDNPQNPFVCVSAETLMADPKDIRIHHHEIGNPNKPVRIHWFTEDGGGDLKVVMRDPGCLSNVSCPNRGHCTAISRLDAAGKVCRYDITLNGRTVDPTVIVDQCCM